MGVVSERSGPLCPCRDRRQKCFIYRRPVAQPDGGAPRVSRRCGCALRTSRDPGHRLLCTLAAHLKCLDYAVLIAATYGDSIARAAPAFSLFPLLPLIARASVSERSYNFLPFAATRRPISVNVLTVDFIEKSQQTTTQRPLALKSCYSLYRT